MAVGTLLALTLTTFTVGVSWWPAWAYLVAIGAIGLGWGSEAAALWRRAVFRAPEIARRPVAGPAWRVVAPVYDQERDGAEVIRPQTLPVRRKSDAT